jgi:hypothetical protein
VRRPDDLQSGIGGADERIEVSRRERQPVDRPRAQPTALRTDDANPSGQNGFEMMSTGSRLDTAFATSSAREPTMTVVRATRERQAASVMRWMRGSSPTSTKSCLRHIRGEMPAASMAQPTRDDREYMKAPCRTKQSRLDSA